MEKSTRFSESIFLHSVIFCHSLNISFLDISESACTNSINSINVIAKCCKFSSNRFKNDCNYCKLFSLKFAVHICLFVGQKFVYKCHLSESEGSKLFSLHFVWLQINENVHFPLEIAFVFIHSWLNILIDWLSFSSTS